MWHAQKVSILITLLQAVNLLRPLITNYMKFSQISDPVIINSYWSAAFNDSKIN